MQSKNAPFSPPPPFIKEEGGTEFYGLSFVHSVGLGPFARSTKYQLVVAHKDDKWYCHIGDENGLDYAVGPFTEQDFSSKWAELFRLFNSN